MAPCLIVGSLINVETTVIITAIPALSSPPSNVVPSDVTISVPMNFFRLGVSFGEIIRS